ncbi:MAG: hypothetical protein P8100_07995 [bacterium]
MKKFAGFDRYFNDPLGKLSVGAILTRPHGRSRNFSVTTNIFRLIKKKKEEFINVGEQQDHFYYSGTSINVNLGGDTTTSLGKSEASIGFATKNSAVVIIENGITTDLFYDDLVDDLERIWYKKKYHTYSRNVFLVTSVIVSRRAKVFYATQNKTSVRLRHHDGLAIVRDLDLINAEFSLGREARSVRMMDIHNRCTVLFSLVRWQNKKDRFVSF